MVWRAEGMRGVRSWDECSKIKYILVSHRCIQMPAVDDNPNQTGPGKTAAAYYCTLLARDESCRRACRAGSRGFSVSTPSSTRVEGNRRGCTGLGIRLPSRPVLRLTLLICSRVLSKRYAHFQRMMVNRDPASSVERRAGSKNSTSIEEGFSVFFPRGYTQPFPYLSLAFSSILSVTSVGNTNLHQN